MASQHSTNDIPTYATPARRPTGAELRHLPEVLLKALRRTAEIVADTETDRAFATYAAEVLGEVRAAGKDLPESVLVRLYDIAQVVSDTNEDGDFAFEADCLLDDINDVAGVPKIRVPVGTVAYTGPKASW